MIRGFVPPEEALDEPYKSIYDPSEVRRRHGRDGKFRFSVNTITYLIPLENEIASFTGSVSALNPTTRYEVGSSYFYSDIVGITTTRKNNRLKFSLATLPLLFSDLASNIAIGALVIPGVMLLALMAFATYLHNSPYLYTSPYLYQTSHALSGLLEAIYPFIIIGVLIWFIVFRKRNYQSQSFALEVNNGKMIGAVISFISLQRQENGQAGGEIITTFAPNFAQTIERIRYLLRTTKQVRVPTR